MDIFLFNCVLRKSESFIKPEMTAATEPESAQPAPKPSEASTAENAEQTKPQQWGYDLYPERRGTFKATWGKIVAGLDGQENLEKMKCERRVWSCIKKSPLVKLMMSALNASGCPVDLRRHLACEKCDMSVTGGYDPEYNQIVICQNTCTDEGMVQGVLAHEMIHMFDWCNNNLDFKNLEHLACTEIRAANLTHCSYMSALVQFDATPFNIKQSHRNCVRSKAVYSVLAARKVSEAEAQAVVDKVFNKCYNDLEPVGRRIRRNSFDMHKAYAERGLYGYD